MDSSIKLQILEGTFRLRAEEIEPETWATLIFRQLDKCKSCPKYFPNQKPIGGLLNCWLREYDYRITPDEVVDLRDELTKTTKCISLVGFESERVARTKLLFDHSDGHPGWLHITRKELWLSANGELVLWVAKERPETRYNRGSRGHREGTDYIAESSIFSVVSEESLASLLKAEPQGLLILQEIKKTIGEAITERTTRLQRFQQTYQDLTETLNLIE